MKVTLRQLHYALAVARHGNITVAAGKLNVSQPAISAAISELEELLGQPVFVRQRGLGVSVTPFGRTVMEKAKRVVAEASELEHLTAGEGEPAGELVLGCFEDLAPYCLPQLLRRLRARYPAIAVEIRVEGFDTLGRLLSEGSLDLILSYDLGLPANVASTVLCELPAYALLPAVHPLAASVSVSLGALSEHPLILTGQAYSGQHFLDLFHFHKLSPQSVYKAHSFELQRGLVANGFGVALSYTRPYGDHSYDGLPLAVRPIAEDLPMQRILLSHDARRPLSPMAQAFLEQASAWFSAHTVFGNQPVGQA
ncbi:LysR family transcriptional regulator [Neisseriaceae bacterium JH1-16]|nr:LysR family transcriptional regulator [Neisseriaceae bacterium JH1-16]